MISSLSWDWNGKDNSWKGKQNLLPEYNGLKDGWLAQSQGNKGTDSKIQSVYLSVTWEQKQCKLGRTRGSEWEQQVFGIVSKVFPKFFTLTLFGLKAVRWSGQVWVKSQPKWSEHWSSPEMIPKNWERENEGPGLPAQGPVGEADGRGGFAGRTRWQPWCPVTLWPGVPSQAVGGAGKCQGRREFPLPF